MSQHKHLLAFDLTSYGSALAIINQFVDDDAVKVFEISPCGSSATLILLAKDTVSLQIIKSEVLSYFMNQVLSSGFIENTHDELLVTYLSQNKPKVEKAMVILEGAFVSEGLEIADKALKNNNSLIDFRVIRTFPKNIVMTFSLKNISDFISVDKTSYKKTLIEDVQPLLKSYFEI